MRLIGLRRSSIQPWTDLFSGELRISVKLKVVLIKEKCWDAVTAKFPEKMEKEVMEEKDLRAHGEIMLRLADEVARQVISFKTTEKLWNALEELYSVKSLPSRINLLVKLFDFKLDLHDLKIKSATQEPSRSGPCISMFRWFNGTGPPKLLAQSGPCIRPSKLLARPDLGHPFASLMKEYVLHTWI